MPTNRFLPVMIALMVSSTAMGGGSVTWEDVLPVLSQNPELLRHVETSLEVSPTGNATRLGNHFSLLGGTRIAPYSFPARPAGSRGDFSLELTINADPVFLDQQGRPLGDNPTQASSVDEVLTGISLTASNAPGHSGPSSPDSPEAMEARTADIRAWFSQLQDQSRQTRQIQFQAENEPLGGTVTWYEVPGSGLEKLEASVGMGDHGGKTETWYFQNGELFFGFIEEGYWSFDPKREGATIDTITETRVYFLEGSVYQTLQKSVTAPTEKVETAISEASNQPIVLTGPEEYQYLDRAYQLLKATSAAEIIRIWQQP